MLRIYVNLGYHIANDFLIEKGLDCDIEKVTSGELIYMRASYCVVIFGNFIKGGKKGGIKGGKYLLNRFVYKSIPYTFITMFADFRPGIDYNDESLKIVNCYYLAKVK